ncbi:hypothetical protein [Rhodoblastus sp.]|uniref:hypothetical protein n=1 Tax=Rhodoblastus sp. TaxID=1962975 RepID=UPI003F9D03CE
MGVKLNVLDPESTGSAYLGEKLQEAFEEIAKERRFDEVTVDDIRLIAAGSGEWRQVDQRGIRASRRAIEALSHDLD